MFTLAIGALCILFMHFFLGFCLQGLYNFTGANRNNHFILQSTCRWILLAWYCVGICWGFRVLTLWSWLKSLFVCWSRRMTIFRNNVYICVHISRWANIVKDIIKNALLASHCDGTKYICIIIIVRLNSCDSLTCYKVYQSFESQPIYKITTQMKYKYTQ